MAVKHTTLPRWATNDAIDPTSLLNNVIEPAEGKKDIGWNYLEKPARQYYNWLGRQTNQWLDYLDEALNLFAPHETNPTTMEIELNPGRINQGTDVIFLGVQTSGAIAAPITNPRIDRVVISESTGAVSVIAGSEAASPVVPAFDINSIPIAQILLYVGMTEIVNDDITDERSKSSSDLSASQDEIITGQWSFDNALTQFGASTPNDSWSVDAIEMGLTGGLSSSGGAFWVTENAYYDSGWKYQNTDLATLIQMSGGNIELRVATSGTEDTAIGWVKAIKAESDGTVKGLGGNWLISPDGTDFTPSDTLSLYKNSDTTVGIRFQNSNTGTLSNDGSLIYVEATSKDFIIRNYESANVNFYTNNTLRGKISAGGNWLISPKGHDITPGRALVVHNGTTSEDTYIQITNDATGIASNNGFILGVSASETADLFNYSNTDMRFFTNDLQEMFLDASNRGLVIGSPTGAGQGVGTANAENGFYEDGTRILRRSIAETISGFWTFSDAIQVGSPTGGDKGVGTVNAENGFYVDGVQINTGTAVAGYFVGNNIAVHDDAAESTSFDVVPNIGTSYESVGPTGSGATNIWSAMNNIPTDAKAMICKIFTTVGGSTNGDIYRARVWGRRTGSTVGTTNSQYISFVEFTNRSGLLETNANLDYVVLPIDSSKRFDLAYEALGTSPGNSISMYFVGWIE